VPYAAPALCQSSCTIDPSNRQPRELRDCCAAADRRKPRVAVAHDDAEQRGVLYRITNAGCDLDRSDCSARRREAIAVSAQNSPRLIGEPYAERRVGDEERKVEQKGRTRGTPAVCAPFPQDPDAAIWARKLEPDDAGATTGLQPAIKLRERYQQSNCRGNGASKGTQAHNADVTVATERCTTLVRGRARSGSQRDEPDVAEGLAGRIRGDRRKRSRRRSSEVVARGRWQRTPQPLAGRLNSREGGRRGPQPRRVRSCCSARPVAPAYASWVAKAVGRTRARERVLTPQPGRSPGAGPSAKAKGPARVTRR